MGLLHQDDHPFRSPKKQAMTKSLLTICRWRGSGIDWAYEDRLAGSGAVSAKVARPRRRDDRKLMKFVAAARSLRLDIARPDHLRPSLGIGLDPPAELFRASRDWLKAERRQALLDVVESGDSYDLAIE